MTVNNLIQRLQELAGAGQGESEVYAGYNTGGPGSSDGEDCFLCINKAESPERLLPKGVWLGE